VTDFPTASFASPRSRDLLFWTLWALATAFSLVPFWTVETLPLNDLGGHLELMDIVARYDDADTVYADTYALPRGPIQTNSISLFAARFVGGWIGIEPVARLLLSWYVIGWTLGSLFLVLIFGGSRWVAFFSFPLLFNPLLGLGLLNFLIAMPLVLLLIGLSFSFGRHRGLRLGAAVLVTSILLFWAHVYACMLGILMANVTLIVSMPSRRDISRALVFIPSLLLTSLWGIRLLDRLSSPSIGHEQGVPDPFFGPYKSLVTRWLDFPGWTMDFFRDRSDGTVVAALAVVFLGLLISRSIQARPSVLRQAPGGGGNIIGRRQPSNGRREPKGRPVALKTLRDRMRERSVWVLCAAFFTAYFLLPSRVLGDVAVAPRAGIFAYLFLLLGAPFSAGRRIDRVLLSMLVLVALVCPWNVRAQYQRFGETEVGDLRKTIAALPDRSSLFIFDIVQIDPITKMAFCWHIPRGFHAVSNGGRTEYSFAVHPFTPVQYQPARAPEPVPEDFFSRPTLLDYDYVLIRVGVEPRRLLDHPKLEFMWRQRSWWLFAVRRPGNNISGTDLPIS